MQTSCTRLCQRFAIYLWNSHLLAANHYCQVVSLLMNVLYDQESKIAPISIFRDWMNVCRLIFLTIAQFLLSWYILQLGTLHTVNVLWEQLGDWEKYFTIIAVSQQWHLHTYKLLNIIYYSRTAYMNSWKCLLRFLQCLFMDWNISAGLAWQWKGAKCRGGQIPLFLSPLYRSVLPTRPSEQCEFCDHIFVSSLISQDCQSGSIGQSSPGGPGIKVVSFQPCL